MMEAFYRVKLASDSSGKQLASITIRTETSFVVNEQQAIALLQRFEIFGAMGYEFETLVRDLVTQEINIPEIRRRFFDTGFIRVQNHSLKPKDIETIENNYNIVDIRPEFDPSARRAIIKFVSAQLSFEVEIKSKEEAEKTKEGAENKKSELDAKIKIEVDPSKLKELIAFKDLVDALIKAADSIRLFFESLIEAERDKSKQKDVDKAIIEKSREDGFKWAGNDRGPPRDTERVIVA
jgi:hypothetical protein